MEETFKVAMLQFTANSYFPGDFLAKMDASTYGQRKNIKEIIKSTIHTNLIALSPRLNNVMMSKQL